MKKFFKLTLLFLLSLGGLVLAQNVPDRSDTPLSYQKAEAQICSLFLGRSITPDIRDLNPGEDDPSDDSLLDYDLLEGWIKVLLLPQVKAQTGYLNVFLDHLADGKFDSLDWIVKNLPLRNLGGKINFSSQTVVLPTYLRITLTSSTLQPEVLNENIWILECGEVEDYFIYKMSLLPKPPQREGGSENGDKEDSSGRDQDKPQDQEDSPASDDHKGGKDKRCDEGRGNGDENCDTPAGGKNCGGDDGDDCKDEEDKEDKHSDDKDDKEDDKDEVEEDERDEEYEEEKEGREERDEDESEDEEDDD